MKKMIVLLTSLLLLVSLVAGCGNKSFSAEEAGNLLIDHFVYDKESKEFTQAFSNAKELNKNSKEIKKVFRDDALTLIVGNMELKDQDIEKLFNSFMTQIEKKTSYKVKEVSKDENSAELEVEVTGLDFSTVLKAYMKDIQKKAMKNPEIEEDEMIALVLDAFNKSIKDAEAIKEPIILSLTLKKEKNKWKVDEDTMDELGAIFNAVFLGVENSNDLDLEEY